MNGKEYRFITRPTVQLLQFGLRNIGMTYDLSDRLVQIFETHRFGDAIGSIAAAKFDIGLKFIDLSPQALESLKSLLGPECDV